MPSARPERPCPGGRSSTSATVFVDTNVLVYVRDSTEPDKQARAAGWVGRLWEDGLGRLSYQVLQEYYVTLTRKLELPRSVEDVRDDVMALHAWGPAVVGRSTLEFAWSVQDRFGTSWWDALIVASAKEAGARYLLSEDFADGRDLEGLTVVSPFQHTPGEILGEV